MEPIRGPPGIEAMQQWEGPRTRRSQHPDLPVDVMPDLRKPEPGLGLVSEFDPTRRELKRRGGAHRRPQLDENATREPARPTGAVRCAASSRRKSILPTKVTVTGRDGKLCAPLTAPIRRAHWLKIGSGFPMLEGVPHRWPAIAPAG